jgi:hypothetical protein
MAFEPCPYCSSDVRVTWWDHALGLATHCGVCGAYSGPRWSTKRLFAAIFASLFANALVLFLVARPFRALVLIGVHVGCVAALFAAASASQSEALFNTALVAIILGPMCIAVSEFYWHARELQQGPLAVPEEPPVEDGPQFFGTNELTEIRNELEIAIYHVVQRIKLLANASYVLAALEAVLAVLGGHWLELSISFVVCGLAYSIQVHESRFFSICYVLFGIALAAEFVRQGIHHDENGFSGALPLWVLIFGFAFTSATFALTRLRLARSRIAMEPAEHLRD